MPKELHRHADLLKRGGHARQPKLRLETSGEGSRNRKQGVAVEDEEHALPLYGVAFRFASWGYRTVVLGPRTPPSALATAVDALKPTVIGLSATIAPPAQQAKRIVEAYAEACRGRPWLIGGQGVKELANHVARTDGIVVDRDLAELRPIFERKARLVSR